VKESLLRTVPPYVLLLASITLCIWMPSAMYNTIINTIKIIGGTIHG
jgi:hydrogenase-4 component F